MNNYKVVISTDLNSMLDNNLSYMKVLSRSYVRSISLEISYFILILEKFPFAFSRFFLPNNNSYFRKITISKRYYLIYRVIDNIVEILYFVDGRRSYENMLTY